jgi:hypothetical protein
MIKKTKAKNLNRKYLKNKFKIVNALSTIFQIKTLFGKPNKLA